MEFQHMYGPRRRVTVECGEGRTKQSFKDECDINVLMRKYLRGGELPGAVSTGSYGDFTGPAELLDAYEVIKRAEQQFAALPSEVRLRFGNRPEVFLAFVQDKANQAEAKKLGLLEEEVPPSRELVELKRIADAAAAAVVAPKPPAA